MSTNQLTVLPEKIFMGLKALEKLNLDRNQLSVLPEKIFSGLTDLSQLDISCNQLRTLANRVFRGLGNLKKLYLLSNQLCELPTSISSLSALRSLRLQNNRLINLPDEFFSLFSRCWVSLDVNNAVNHFHLEVLERLQRLERSPALRERVFSIAHEGLGSCEDRISLTLNEMKKTEIIFDIEAGAYDTEIGTLILLARQQFRLDALSKIAAVKVKNLRAVDEIEVYLSYQVKLQEKMDLGVSAKAMRFFDVAGVTADDLQVAELQIKQDENQNFKRYFSGWGPWQKVLERLAPEDYKKLQEDIYLASEKQYESASVQQSTEISEAKRIKLEQALVDDLEWVAVEHKMKVTEHFLGKQFESLSEFNRQAWEI